MSSEMQKIKIIFIILKALQTCFMCGKSLLPDVPEYLFFMKNVNDVGYISRRMSSSFYSMYYKNNNVNPTNRTVLRNIFLLFRE